MGNKTADCLMHEESTHYALPLVGREIDQICVDYAVTLVIEGTDTVRLESPFTVFIDGRTYVVDPERIHTVAVVLELHRAVVTRAEAGKDGTLHLAFDEDRWLHADPIEDGEAWEIGGGLPPVTPCYLIAAEPGGGLRLG
ncbi:MAG: DUF6188 family protein [Candidatus Phosphoribacter sp.]|nr:hypothetical protein [Actinomycetales bacterium]